MARTAVASPFVAIENRRETVVKGVSGENGSAVWFSERECSGGQRQACFRGAGVSRAVGSAERSASHSSEV